MANDARATVADMARSIKVQETERTIMDEGLQMMRDRVSPQEIADWLNTMFRSLERLKNGAPTRA